jgi:organic radical activating enzyme
MKDIANIIIPFTETWMDYPDNESNAIEIFIMGCNNFCINCHNPEFADENYSINTIKFSPKELALELQKECNSHNTNKIVMEGGDPLFYNNVKFTKQLLIHLYILGNYNIIIYTGHNIEYVLKQNLKYFNYIKCGKYIPEYAIQSDKTNEYIQFASTNQELYDENFKKISKNGRYYFK